MTTDAAAHANGEITMQTYTVLDTDGKLIARHLTPAEAAHIILTDDGREYEVRENDGIFLLWSRQQVANRPWAKTIVFSLADTIAEAEAEIFASVISANWSRHPQAMTDAEFDAISA
jgi:hypothetical protein